MNIWDDIFDFLFPASTTITTIWDGLDEPPFDDGKDVLTPVIIAVTFRARHKLGEEIDDSKYRFYSMEISGPLIANRNVIVTKRFDKIKKVPVRFMELTDRSYTPEADKEG